MCELTDTSVDASVTQPRDRSRTMKPVTVPVIVRRAPPTIGVAAVSRVSVPRMEMWARLPSARERVEAEHCLQRSGQLSRRRRRESGCAASTCSPTDTRWRGNVAGSCENADWRSRGMSGSRGHDGRRALAREPHAHLLPLQGAPRLIAPRRDAGIERADVDGDGIGDRCGRRVPSSSDVHDDRAGEHQQR